MDELFTASIIETKYQRLKAQIGQEMALFALCAVLDMPYEAKTDADSWAEYLTILQDSGFDPDGGFNSGVIDTKVPMRAEQPDMEQWMDVWGIGNPSDPYTAADYKRLDYLFDTYSARLAASGGYDAQQEFIIRSVCADQMLAEKCRNLGTKEGIETYTKLTKTIQDKLSAENLRKKDILPQQEQRPDGFIDKMMQKYGVGQGMTYDQVMSVIFRWMRSHNYPETADAAENGLLAIINCTRRNNDMPEIDELPQSMKFNPKYNAEFADEPNDEEGKVYEYLRLTRKDGK